MYPVLNVDGKEYKAREVNYNDQGEITYVGIFRENGIYTHYFDNAAECYIEKALQVNMQTALKWVDRYSDLYETIDKIIEDNQKEVQGLATEIADNVLPFKFSEKAEERNKLKERTFGLMDAQDIILEFMSDDFDENLID